MIEIICNNDWCTYNVFHLTKAFFPETEVRQRVDKVADAVVWLKLLDDSVFQVQQEELARWQEQKEKKYQLDRMLYERLRSYTGRGLHWGLLTGVRPTKIAMKMLTEGMEREAFVHWFQNHALVSYENAVLSWEIAVREKAMLDRLDCKDGYSLYVGIPFCPSVCTYCSFSSGSLTQWRNQVDAYLEALCRELSFIASVSEGKKLNTIYIGGGTPTTLSAGQLEKLLTCIDEHFSREELVEYTVEAGRPDSISAEKLKVLLDHNITRISINPQSMQQKTLDAIGRKHTVGQTIEAYELARKMGFDNINMDLIAGLPGENLFDMQDTLRQIEALAPDNLTVHSLAIKRAAAMAQEKNRQVQMKDELSDMIAAAQESALRMHLFPYYLYRQKNMAGNFENVGYAKVDKAGIYNILIMEEKQSIIAAGAGASTKIVLPAPRIVQHGKKAKETSLVRIENVKAIDAYIARIDEMIERKGEWLWH